MEQEERGHLTASYISTIMAGVEMILMDEDNLPFLEEAYEDMAKRVNMGYAFPMMNYSKVDRLKAEMCLLGSIITLCEARIDQKRVSSNPGTTLDDVVMKALGL